MARNRTSLVMLPLALALWSCTADAPVLPEPNWEIFPPALQESLRSQYVGLNQNHENSRAVADLAMHLHAFDQYGAASEYYQRAAELDPSDARWLYLLGVSRSLAGDSDAAEDAFRRVLRERPDVTEARLRLADLLLESGNIEEAKELFLSVETMQPGLPTAQYGLGRVAVERGDDARAVERFQRACGLAPWYSAARYALAQALQRLGQEQAAAQQMSIFERRPKINEVVADPLLDQIDSLREGVAPNHLARGKVLEEEGRLREAVEEYEKALAADPDYAVAHVNLLSAYGGLGELDKAEQHYRQAVELGSEAPELAHNYGVLQASQGRWAAAVSHFQEALRRDPAFADALNDLGVCLEQTGQVRAAINRYREALEVEPYHRQASYHLARHRMLAGKPSEAAELLQRAVLPDDGLSAQYLLALAEAQTKAGNGQAARSSLTRAAELAGALGLDEVRDAARRRLGEAG